MISDCGVENIRLFPPQSEIHIPKSARRHRAKDSRAIIAWLVVSLVVSPSGEGGLKAAQKFVIYHSFLLFAKPGA